MSREGRRRGVWVTKEETSVRGRITKVTVVPTSPVVNIFISVNVLPHTKTSSLYKERHHRHQTDRSPNSTADNPGMISHTCTSRPMSFSEFQEANQCPLCHVSTQTRYTRVPPIPMPCCCIDIVMSPNLPITDLVDVSWGMRYFQGTRFSQVSQDNSVSILKTENTSVSYCVMHTLQKNPAKPMESPTCVPYNWRLRFRFWFWRSHHHNGLQNRSFRSWFWNVVIHEFFVEVKRVAQGFLPF